MPANERSSGIIRLIALFRGAKAIVLIASGLAGLRLLKPGALASVVTRIVAGMPWASQHAFVHRAVASVTRLSPKRIEELSIGAFVYAAVFLVEGTGLWMRKVWAEWLTIVVTTSLIPFEVYEVVHKTTALRVIVLALNIAIVVYLVWRRRRLK